MDKSLLETLLDVLNQAQIKPVEGFKLKQWRITLAQSQRINIGVKNNNPGSVYTPPSYSNREGGEVFLIWEDDKCSKARVQNVFEREDYWLKQLSLWRLTAYNDHHEMLIPVPEKLPQVQIANKDISNLFTGDNRQIFEHQQKIIFDRPEIALTNASLLASWTRNLIYTSTGIAADFPESRYAVSWSFDSQISQGFAERRFPTLDEWKHLWEESVSRYSLLQNKSQPITKDTVVILAPQVVDQMIEQFIIPNFKGENVLENQSRFETQDFHKEQLFFDEKLSLEIDPLRPEKWTSYILTSEGIPATTTLLVDKGRLLTPYLNTKDGKRWRAHPTALPLGSGGIIINHKSSTNWSQKINEIQDGVLVLSVLGLHTQNHVAGSYSLAAPSCLRIEKGILTGRTDVRISGNMWRIMKSKDTTYAFSEHDNHPYIITTTRPENL
ncbi:MAG: hypothetical protein APF84_15095 [Gracilibacter sp. BRH_c7a]|nr:MAG: hypothetical protein APF84_15095 [Gracilibacter sp. BRH_c7a]